MRDVPLNMAGIPSGFALVFLFAAAYLPPPPQPPPSDQRLVRLKFCVCLLSKQIIMSTYCNYIEYCDLSALSSYELCQFTATVLLYSLKLLKVHVQNPGNISERGAKINCIPFMQ